MGRFFFVFFYSSTTTITFKLFPSSSFSFYRTCMITLRLSDLKSQASLSLLLRHHELTNENVSYFLINQSKAMTFIDHTLTRKLVRPVKSLKIAHDRILMRFLYILFMR